MALVEVGLAELVDIMCRGIRERMEQEAGACTVPHRGAGVQTELAERSARMT